MHVKRRGKIAVGRIVVVISCDEPEAGAMLTAESILETIRPAFTDKKNPHIWVGVRESAEAVLKITGEI